MTKIEESALRRAHAVEAALEASCEALLAFELVGANALDDEGLVARTRPVIDSLHRVIPELRRVYGGPVSALSFGFVLGT